jgi:hypothetical protein
MTRLSKGELSPLLNGSSDLAQYFEGGSTIENAKVIRQGGVTRWEGTRFIKAVKDSASDSILWPFEFSVEESYMLEVGDLYVRIYKTKAPVLETGVHVEVVTPFLVADVRAIHMTQSADVLFLFHRTYQQRKLSRVSDTSWALTTMAPSPPPSFEADTNLGDTLALEALTGTSVQCRAGSAVFLNADVGRQIISGVGRAIITTFTDTSEVLADIIDPFTETITAGPNTLTSVGTAVTSTAHGATTGYFVQLTAGAQIGQMREIVATPTADTFTLLTAFTVDQGAPVAWNKIVPLAAGAWALRLSPQTTLNPDKKSPIGTSIALAAGVAAFRSADVGKYIKIYGGVVRLTVFTSTTAMTGILESVMGEATTADPAAADAGTWTLEAASWSGAKGYPRTGDFFQGRLYQASTASQPVTFWGSAADDFENYALGLTAEDAVEYTIASRQVNQIEWLTEKNKALFIGTSGSEHIATGSGNTDALIGGDTIPQLDRLATNGCAPIQPVVARQFVLYIDRSRRKVMMMGFNLESDGQTDVELTVSAEHITESGVRLGPVAFEKRLDPRFYFVREDGQLVAMTFFPEQKVVAFSRRTTPGTFQCAAIIPNATGGPDQVWAIVQRTINGASKRYVELFEPAHELLTTAYRGAMQTDCGIVQTGLTGTTVTGLSHLEAATVDVMKNGSYLGQEVVAGGQITLDLALIGSDVVEVGLHYETTVRTMEPAMQSHVIDGLPRSWESLFARLHRTLGGTINGEPIQYPPATLEPQGLYSGIRKVSTQTVDEDGRVTLVQNQPYPWTVLGIFGTLNVGETD